MIFENRIFGIIFILILNSCMTAFFNYIYFLETINNTDLSIENEKYGISF